MRLTMNKRAALAAVLLAACVPAGVRAQTPPPPPPRGEDGLRALGLSPDQMRRVRDLHRQIGPQIRDLERSLRDRRQALEAMYRNYDMDLPQARKLNAQIHCIQSDILDANLRLQVELRKILNEDQFARLQQNIASRRNRVRPPGPPPGKP